MNENSIIIQNSFFRSYVNYDLHLYLKNKALLEDENELNLRVEGGIRKIELTLLYLLEYLMFGYIFYEDGDINRVIEKNYPLIENSDNLDVLFLSARILIMLKKRKYNRFGIKIFEKIIEENAKLKINFTNFYLISYDFFSELFNYSECSGGVLSYNDVIIRDSIIASSYLHLGLYHHSEVLLTNSYTIKENELCAIMLFLYFQNHEHKILNTRYENLILNILHITVPKRNIFNFPEKMSKLEPHLFRYISAKIREFNFY